MSSECDMCGGYTLDCKCELIEMNKMRIENLKRQRFYLEKFFPWTSGPYEEDDEIALQKLEEVLYPPTGNQKLCIRTERIDA